MHFIFLSFGPYFFYVIMFVFEIDWNW